MISPHSLQKEHISKLKAANRRSDPGIIEKAIRALKLVEELPGTELSFVFKGGTCLMLHFSEPKRFSIDVDIVTTDDRKIVERALDQIVLNGTFKRWELDDSRSYQGQIPKAHYNLFFDSEIHPGERYLIFDVLYEEHGYQETIKLPVRSSLVVCEGAEVEVTVPSINALLGDKLTAFAPKTVGVPYGKRKEMEIIKQLFDVGVLFDHVSDMSVVSKTFMNTVTKEIQYRNPDLKPESVLQDIHDTSFLLGIRGTDKERRSEYGELQTGARAFTQFSLVGSFTLDSQAIIASAKAAYLAALIKSGVSDLEYFTSDLDINQFLIESTPYTQLNKLRKLPGGSLFYWSHIAKLQMR